MRLLAIYLLFNVNWAQKVWLSRADLVPLYLFVGADIFQTDTLKLEVSTIPASFATIWRPSFIIFTIR